MQTIPVRDSGDGIRRGDIGAAFMGTHADAFTVNTALTANQTGKAFTNSGASGEVDFSLPAAVAGLWYIIAVVANQVVKVLPTGGAKINNASTSLNAAAPAPGVQWAYVLCIDGVNWSAMTNGTWTLT